MNFEVVHITQKDLIWSFTPSYGGNNPYFVTHTSRWHGRQVPVDAFPGYAHNLELTHTILEKVTKKFPIGVKTYVHVTENEFLERTNGWCSCETDYDVEYEEGKPRPWIASIVLSGKRIPPHPAMTRYLVAHEYGHAVERWIANGRNEKEGTDTMIKEYAKLRKLESGIPYGGGKWHITPGEVFANDFRILVCGVEKEFWPHPTVPRPETSKAAIGWWKKEMSVNKLRFASGASKVVDLKTVKK